MRFRIKRDGCVPRRVVACATTAVTSCVAFASTAFAAGEEVFGASDFASALHRTFTMLSSVGLACFVLALVVCGLMYFVGSEKASEFAVAWGKKIIMATACLALLPNIIWAGYSTFKGIAWNPDVSQNQTIVEPDDALDDNLNNIANPEAPSE